MSLTLISDAKEIPVTDPGPRDLPELRKPTLDVVPEVGKLQEVDTSGPGESDPIVVARDSGLESVANNNEPELTTLEWSVRIVSFAILFLVFPVSIWFCIKYIHPYETGLSYRFGKIRVRADSGLMLVNPVTDSFDRLDRRKVSLEPGRQLIVTRDGSFIVAQSVIHFKVIDPVKTNLVVADVGSTMSAIVSSKIDEEIRERTFDQVLVEQNEVEMIVKDGMKDVAADMGVQLVEIDIFFRPWNR